MDIPLVIALALTAITLTAYLLIGVMRKYEVRTLDDFMLYGRNLTEKQYEGTFIATSISLATVLFFFLDFSGPLGLAIVLSPLMYALGNVLFVRVLPVLQESGYLQSGTTLHNFIGFHLQSDCLRQATAIVSIVGYLGILIIELHVGATIFSIFSDNPLWPWIVVVLLLCLIGLYTIMGGYKAVVDTDAVQLLLIKVGTVCALLALIWLYAKGPTKNDIWLPEKLLPLPWYLPLPFLIVMIVGNVPFQMLRMDGWLRVIAVGDLAKVTDAYWHSIRGAVVWWFVFVAMGLLLFALSSVTPGQGMIVFFNLLLTSENALFQTIVFPLLFIAAVAAMISTADSVFQPVIAAWLYDLKFWKETHQEGTGAARLLSDAENKKILGQVRRATFVLLVIAGFFYIVLTKLLSFNFVDLLFVFFNQQLVLFFPVAIALGIAHQKFRDEGKRSQISRLCVVGMAVGLTGAWLASLYAAWTDKQIWTLLSSSIAICLSSVPLLHPTVIRVLGARNWCVIVAFLVVTAISTGYALFYQGA